MLKGDEGADAFGKTAMRSGRISSLFKCCAVFMSATRSHLHGVARFLSAEDIWVKREL